MKKSIEASFVEGKKPSKTPKPKSLTPKVKTMKPAAKYQKTIK